MQTLREEHSTTASWLVHHPFSAEDQVAMAAMRAIVEPNKGKLQGIAARVPFNAITERVAAPPDVFFEADRVGGISGWWCRPQAARAGQAIMHIHGGWFNWGSATAFRNLAGQIAAIAGVAAFVPDYRLAPEHPFPAAVEDVKACYAGLVERGFSKIAITGDSAGGNLAFGLLVYLANVSASGRATLVGGVALSPVTDLTFSGESWSSRAVADPYFTQPQVASLVQSYLAGHDPKDPFASPLQADLKNLAPIRVHVGEDEVLLEDSVRLVKRAVAAEVDARLDIWQGMVHGFLGGIKRLEASTKCLSLIGKFLIEQFAEAEKGGRAH